MVLGRGPHHRGPTDVDLLDALFLGGTCAHRVGERIKVGNHQVKRLNTQVGQLGHVVRVAGIGKDPGVDRGMQGLDPTAQNLGKTRQVLNTCHRHARIGDPRGS